MRPAMRIGGVGPIVPACAGTTSGPYGDPGDQQSGRNGCMTGERFEGHFQLHVEFRVPFEPEKAGQARGNGGVYRRRRGEVQVLDCRGRAIQDTNLWRTL